MRQLSLIHVLTHFLPQREMPKAVLPEFDFPSEYSMLENCAIFEVFASFTDIYAQHTGDKFTLKSSKNQTLAAS